MTESSSSVDRYRAFMDGFQSVILATVDRDGIPDASYAPYVRDERTNVYLLASELASHTSNLLTTGRASLLWIEDEENSPNIFGRRRLSFNCTVAEIDRADARWTEIIDRLQEARGERVAAIAFLGDFHLFCLTPTRGRFVEGFGGIYEIAGENMAQVVPFKPRQ